MSSLPVKPPYTGSNGILLARKEFGQPKTVGAERVLERAYYVWQTGELETTSILRTNTTGPFEQVVSRMWSSLVLIAQTPKASPFYLAAQFEGLQGFERFQWLERLKRLQATAWGRAL